MTQAIHILRKSGYNCFFIIFCFSLLISAGCKKYLEKKPASSLALPETLDDLQAMLDNYGEINEGFYPGVAEFLSDDSYLVPDYIEYLLPEYKNVYTWQPSTQTIFFWYPPYKNILTTNVVLESLAKIPVAVNPEKWNSIRGSALLIRSMHFAALSELFTLPYSEETANTTPGIVLKLSSDINLIPSRATVKDTYSQIINDLKIASELLPLATFVKSRPSKPSAYGALARIYLSIRKYDSAGIYADKCLSLNDSLMKFSMEVDVNSPTPFRRFNKEVIFQMRSQPTYFLSFPFSVIDTNLYNSYSENDLRKNAYFDKQNIGIFFKGDYDGAGVYNNGYVNASITTNEMFLIRAEANVRSGRIQEGLNDINFLLKTRWNNSVPYVEISESNQGQALKIVLLERRKELIRRGLRWSDIRRFKFEPENSVIIKREVNGEKFELPISSLRYAMKIPIEVINRSGIEQNP